MFHSSTFSTTQTVQPFNMEELCKETERQHKIHGIPSYDLRVRCFVFQPCSPTHHPLNHSKEHPIHICHPCSHAQGTLELASLPSHLYTSSTLSTTKARVSRNPQVWLFTMARKTTQHAEQCSRSGGSSSHITITSPTTSSRFTCCTLLGHTRFAAVVVDFSKPSNSLPKSSPPCSVCEACSNTRVRKHRLRACILYLIDDSSHIMVHACFMRSEGRWPSLGWDISGRYSLYVGRCSSILSFFFCVHSIVELLSLTNSLFSWLLELYCVKTSTWYRASNSYLQLQDPASY